MSWFVNMNELDVRLSKSDNRYLGHFGAQLYPTKGLDRWYVFQVWRRTPKRWTRSDLESGWCWLSCHSKTRKRLCLRTLWDFTQLLKLRVLGFTEELLCSAIQNVFITKAPKNCTLAQHSAASCCDAQPKSAGGLCQSGGTLLCQLGPRGVFFAFCLAMNQVWIPKTWGWAICQALRWTVCSVWKFKLVLAETSCFKACARELGSLSGGQGDAIDAMQSDKTQWV